MTYQPFWLAAAVATGLALPAYAQNTVAADTASQVIETARVRALQKYCDVETATADKVLSLGPNRYAVCGIRSTAAVSRVEVGFAACKYGSGTARFRLTEVAQESGQWRVATANLFSPLHNTAPQF